MKNLKYILLPASVIKKLDLSFIPYGHFNNQSYHWLYYIPNTNILINFGGFYPTEKSTKVMSNQEIMDRRTEFFEFEDTNPDRYGYVISTYVSECIYKYL